jgi:hypothetical protein
MLPGHYRSQTKQVSIYQQDPTKSNNPTVEFLRRIISHISNFCGEFAPTYKYFKSNCYRYTASLPGRSGEKQRAPVWYVSEQQVC